MIQVYKIDPSGFYIEPVIIEPEQEIPTDCVSVQPPDGLYKAKWTGTEWIESLTPAEIDAIKNAPTPTDESDIQALAIMELAELVLKGGV